MRRCISACIDEDIYEYVSVWSGSCKQDFLNIVRHDLKNVDGELNACMMMFLQRFPGCSI